MKSSTRILSLIPALALALCSAGVQADERSNTVAGAIIGGAAGAMVGHHVSGRDGAAVGGILGAVTGAAIAGSASRESARRAPAADRARDDYIYGDDDDDRYDDDRYYTREVTRERVVYVEPQVRERVVVVRPEPVVVYRPAPVVVRPAPVVYQPVYYVPGRTIVRYDDYPGRGWGRYKHRHHHDRDD